MIYYFNYKSIIVNLKFIIKIKNIINFLTLTLKIIFIQKSITNDLNY